MWVVNMVKKILVALLCLSFWSSFAMADSTTIVFDFQQSLVDFQSTAAGVAVSYPGCYHSPEGPQPRQNHTYLIENGRLDSIGVVRRNPFLIANLPGPLVSDEMTTYAGDETRDPGYYRDKLRGLADSNNDTVAFDPQISRSRWGRLELANVEFSFFDYNDQTGSLRAWGVIELHFYGDSSLAYRELSSTQDLSHVSDSPHGPFSGAAQSPDQPQSSPEYLVVTNQALASAFEPLLEWKTAKGLTAGLTLIEEVAAAQDGLDNAERLRNFLISAHQGGTRYVLLGGDESVIPIRYAFNQNTSTLPDLDVMQICDLYYSDLTGAWDVDGDGVYGEPTDDAPDLYPELLVGRLPVDTPAEVSDYVAKLLNYEQHPDNSGGYLFKSLAIAADQMRDYNQGEGQHQLIASAIPNRFSQDLNTLIEAPSGNAENPLTPLATTAIASLDDGWGIISLLVHGISDGWVSRSNLYNQWPKSYIFVRSGTSGTHGYLPQPAPNGKPGLVYSVGCSHGAFDMDAPPFESTSPCVAESFLTATDGGAVAFVGYSRWGWVSSSWRLEQAFLEHLFNESNQVSVAMAYSKAQYPQYRDINYGLNLYGDPELRIWIDAPLSLNIQLARPEQSGFVDLPVTVSSNGDRLQDVVVTLSCGDEMLAQELTGSDGGAILHFEYDESARYRITAYKAGHVLAEDQLAPGIVLDADDEVVLPDQFQLRQNFPNPFNPSTTISFTLGRSAAVTLEIFNILGQRVYSLNAGVLPAGLHQLSWDSCNDYGMQQPSGVYFARVRAGSNADVIKMSLLK